VLGADPSFKDFYWIGMVAVLLTPAPDLLTVLTCAYRKGRDAGLVAVLAVMTVLFVYAAAAVTGLGFLIENQFYVFGALRWFAIACLIYLAFEALAPVLQPDAEPEPLVVPAATLYGQVLLRNLVNPKFLLFFFSMLHYAAGDAPNLLETWIFDLVVAFVVGEFVLLILIALVAGWIGARRAAGGKRRRLFAWAEGLIHVSLALSLLAA
jgi:threonine/homoserine/homoserine lactone efflux protein